MDLSTMSEGEERNRDSSATLDNAPDNGHNQTPADEIQTDDYASHDMDDTYNSKYASERANNEPASMEIVASEQGQEHDTARPTTPDSRLPRERAAPPSPEPTPRTARRFDIEQKRGYHRKNRPKTAVTYLKDPDIIAPFAPVRKVVVEEEEEEQEEKAEEEQEEKAEEEKEKKEEEEEGRLLDEERAFYLTGLRHRSEAVSPSARGRLSHLNPSSQGYNKALKDLDWEKELVKSLKDKIKEQQDELTDQSDRSRQEKDKLQLEIQNLLERQKWLEDKLNSYRETFLRLRENDKERQAQFEEKVGKLNKYTDDLQDRKEVLESENEGLQKRVKELETQRKNQASENQTEILEEFDEYDKYLEALIKRKEDDLRESGYQEDQDERLQLRNTIKGLEKSLRKEKKSSETALKEKTKQYERLAFESREREARFQRESLKLQKSLKGKDDEMKLMQQRIKMAKSSTAASGSANRTGPTPLSVANESVATSTTSVPQVQPSEQPKFSLLAESRQWQERISGWRKGGEWQEMRAALRRQRQEENQQEPAAKT